jgi:hypothetical protein
MMIFASSKLRNNHKTAPAGAVLPQSTMMILEVECNVPKVSHPSTLFILPLLDALVAPLSLHEFRQFHKKTVCTFTHILLLLLFSLVGWFLLLPFCWLFCWIKVDGHRYDGKPLYLDYI